MASADGPSCGAAPLRSAAGRGAGSAGTLAVEVTTRCNRSCSYCYNAWKADPGYPRQDELPAGELVALVQRVLAASGLRQVQISGGEPFLRPELPAILAGLRQGGAGVSLVTDGSLIDEERAALLARLRVRPVQPTLLAADRCVHDELKGAACFDATVAAIGRLQHAGVPLAVAFVCTRRNVDRFREVVELCFALGVKTIAFSRFCAAGEGGRRREELAPDAAGIASCLEVAEWANARLGMDVRIAISLPLCGWDLRRYPHLRFGRCAVTSDRPGFTIDPAGNLRACSISPILLGNLVQESWEVLLARAQGGYFREVAAPPAACRGCRLLARCGGGCRETARTCTGSPDQPDPLALPTRAAAPPAPLDPGPPSS